MLKKRVIFILLFFIIFLINNNCFSSYSFSAIHTLPNNWYNEEKTQLKKSEVRSISIEYRSKDFDEDEYDLTWDIDNKGLKGYLINEKDVIISVPEVNYLKAAEDASYMFSFCEEIYDGAFILDLESELISIDNLSLLDTSEVTNMSYMFYGNINLEKLDVSSFNTSNVTNMSHMFYCTKWIRSLNLKSFNAEKVRDISYMFYENENLESIDLSNFNFKVLSNMQSLFCGCKKLKDINIKNLDLSYANNNEYMFSDCENIEKIDFSGVKVPKILKRMFSDIKSERLKVLNMNTKDVIDMQGLFSHSKNLKYLNFNCFDTINVENMNSMFSDLESLENLDISNLNTSSVNDMNSMFRNMYKLKELNLSNFNTSNVIDMTNMFSNCKNLNKLDISNFNTNKVKDIYEMFYNLRSLESLDISSFIIDNIFYKDKLDYYLDFSTKTLTNLKSIKINYDLLNKLKEFEYIKSWDNPEGYLYIRKNDYLVHFEPKDLVNIPDMYVEPNTTLKLHDKYDDYYYDLNHVMSINYNKKYSFEGFYEDKECTKTIYGSINIDKNDFTIYVKAKARTCKVKFDTNGGTDVPNQIVVYEEKATKPIEVPIKSLYTFEGWYTDNIKYIEEFDFNKPITNDTEIYAKYRYTG